jgi:hypothetical protein
MPIIQRPGRFDGCPTCGFHYMAGNAALLDRIDGLLAAIVRETNDAAIASAWALQAGAVVCAETILEQCREQLSPAAVNDINEVLRQFAPRTLRSQPVHLEEKPCQP